MSTESKRERFLNTYGGRKLLEEYSLDADGVWEIRGEDPNCDFGGYHHQPYLTDAKGKLTDVIDYAVELDGFWGWGSGGTIKPRSAPVVVDATVSKRRAELRERIRRLDDELYNAKEDLKRIGG